LRAIQSSKYYTREPLERRPSQHQGEQIKKIKVAYFSADFHNHATMRLMSGMLKKHDKTKFEIYTFMYGKSEFDQFTELTKHYSEKFFDISKMSDKETVDLVDGLNIDIAIDLKGYTKESRSHLFSYRLAPIQINYLGYPNTMGADFIDYIIADKTIIPERLKSYYTEKILYMPGCYQPNDIERKIGDTGMMKSDLGISEKSFVMGCLNTNYKITNKEFDVWFSILKQINNSVLVLLATNKWAVENIYAAAKRRNISREQIKFVPKIGYEKHLERLKLVDVFVDTFRVNAHTTASDALWVGTPIVTLVGEQFAARVAASLLKNVGLDELITSNVEEYKSKIVELGNNKTYLTKIKNKLEKAKTSSSLFDTQKYTRDFEALIKIAYENFKKNRKISDIEIE
jgi:predicted O-linked N-acetylglucosamine transferase (SPINDLY family)